VGMPVTVIAGLAGPAKSALIAHWRTQALSPAALIIDRGEDFKFPREQAGSAGEDPAIERIGGCVCCSASMALGGALRKLQRRGEWAHLLVDLNGGAHPAAFIDALRAPALSGALRLGELVSVIDALRLQQRLAGPQRRWLAEQVQSSHRLVLYCPASMPHVDIEVQVASVLELGGRDSFAAEILVWREGEPPPGPAVVGAQGQGESAAILRSGIVAQLQALPVGRAPACISPAWRPEGPHWRWLWRASPERVFERARIAEVLGGWAGGAQQLQAVFRTERDWYRFHGERHEPDLWRRDSRVQIVMDALELAALREPLRGLADRLSGCLGDGPQGT
jgi:hypothetical protein